MPFGKTLSSTVANGEYWLVALGLPVFPEYRISAPSPSTPGTATTPCNLGFHCPFTRSTSKAGLPYDTDQLSIWPVPIAGLIIVIDD